MKSDSENTIKSKVKKSARKVVAKAMAAAGVTINSLFVWLNGIFGSSLPTLDSPNLPPILIALWDLPVPGGLPTGDPPWTIQVDGSWPAMFSQGGSPPLQMENFTVHVKQVPKGQD
jgi:hypothetical protein